MDQRNALQVERKPKAPDNSGSDMTDDGVGNGQLVGADPFDQIGGQRGMQAHTSRWFFQVLGP